MPDSQVIARRFRPQSFDQVVGQEAITRTLTNSIESNRLHHAYLFAGARGVGKTTTARILAKALNCVNGVTTSPCGVCHSCIEIANSSSIDVMEIDAASNTGVDNVRDSIINTVSIAPARDRYKIFIIDEVHQLSSAAFNALLKTLEEPPPHVLFVMATTEIHKVPETILSRCQVFEFRTISSKRILDQLRNIAGELGVGISDAALLSLARAGEGSMRDAESALDQVISFAGKEISADDVSAALGLVGTETLNALTEAIADENSQTVLRTIEEVVARGYDLRNLCRQMMTHLRTLLVLKISGFDEELLEASSEEADALNRLAAAFSEQDLIRFFTILTKTEQDIKLSSQPRFQLEIGLIKLVHARRLYLIEDALSDLREMRSRLSGQGPAVSGLRETETRERAGPPGARGSTGSATLGPGAPEGRGPRGPAGSAPGRPQSRPVESPPVQPRPSIDSAGSQAAPSGSETDRIIAELESQKKMLLAGKLHNATACRLDGETLVVTLSNNDRLSKDEIQTIGEAGLRALGRRLRVSTAGSQADAASPDQTPENRPAARERAAASPTVKALVDKFHGEIVDVTEPKAQSDPL